MKLETVISADAADVARRVAERFEGLAATAMSRKIAVALSGGSTPKRLYELLAEAPFRDRVNWRGVEFFFGDERAVPPDHPDSNYRMANEALLSKVPVTAHRMHAEADAAEAYERLLRERIAEQRGGIPLFDLILLGMGPDGHTASLFPGTQALDERARLVVMNDVPQQTQKRRMTFTYPLLNAARHVWVLAPGTDKRAIVEQCMAVRDKEGAEMEFPVVGIRPLRGELIWWLDEASAGRTSS
jgi:6-phosphogluconolactonase